MPVTLEEQLGIVHTELKTYFAKGAEEVKTLGTMQEATRNAVDKLQKQVDAIETKIADKHAAEDTESAPVEKALRESESIQRLLRDRAGRAVITLQGKAVNMITGRKTTITSGAVGWQTTGVLQIERIPGITVEGRQVLKIRDVLAASPTSYQVVDYVKVLSPLAIASPVPEASLKPENAVTFTSYSERIKTIATFIPATRQILDDFTELAAFLNTGLGYYTDLAEELQLLSGDNVGEDLHGLIPQSTAFNTGLLNPTAGWTRIDVIGRAIEQIQLAKELPPTFVVLNVADWWSLRLTKDNYGRYILGDPQVVGAPNVWGLDLVATTSIAQGTFLVGSGNAAASEIRDRMQLQIEISTEHQDFFVRNLVAIRAEKRLALIVKRPLSYITGTLNSSPVT